MKIANLFFENCPRNIIESNKFHSKAVACAIRCDFSVFLLPFDFSFLSCVLMLSRRCDSWFDCRARYFNENVEYAELSECHDMFVLLSETNIKALPFEYNVTMYSRSYQKWNWRQSMTTVSSFVVYRCQLFGVVSSDSIASKRADERNEKSDDNGASVKRWVVCGYGDMMQTSVVYHFMNNKFFGEPKFCHLSLNDFTANLKIAMLFRIVDMENKADKKKRRRKNALKVIVASVDMMW